MSKFARVTLFLSQKVSFEMNDSRSLDLFEQWNTIMRLFSNHFWTMVTFFTVTLLVVLMGTSLQTPVYRASATVLIDMETPTVLAVSTSPREDYTRADISQVSYMTYADYYRTQLEVIRSRTIVERAFANLGLTDEKPYRQKRDPVGELLKQIEVEPVKQTRLAKIHVEDTDSKRAARIANEVGLVFAEENLAKTASNETLTLMKNEYLKLQTRETELSKRYKKKFPARVRVKQQMEELARAIDQEAKKQLYYSWHQGEEKGLSSKAPAAPLTERLRASSTIGGLRPNNIRVQDLAQPPLKPAKPNVKVNFLLGLLLGFMGSLGAAVVEELLDNSIKGPEDLGRDSRFLLLGHIPRFDELQTEESRGLNPAKRYQYLAWDGNSQAAEAYRALRTNLIYAAPQSASHAIVVTSPGSEEGKTTTLTNLGIALSQIGLKILLVDADLRKPKLHEAFELSQKPGLSEFLIGQASFEKVVRATTLPGVWVVTSGASPPNPAELLGHTHMREFLKQATAKFDRVFIDAPPVVPVTDAVVLAAMTGTILAVAQSGRTPRQALYRLTSVVHDVHAKVLGVVLNNVLPRNFPAYGYGYSVYQYGNHSDSSSQKAKGGVTLADGLKNRLSSLLDYLTSDRLSGFLKHLQAKALGSFPPKGGKRLTRRDAKNR